MFIISLFFSKKIYWYRADFPGDKFNLGISAKATIFRATGVRSKLTALG